MSNQESSKKNQNNSYEQTKITKNDSKEVINTENIDETETVHTWWEEIIIYIYNP